MLIRILIIVFLLITALGTLILSIYSAKRLKISCKIAFIFFLLSICIYTLGYAFELSQDTATGIFLALKIEYIGIPFISFFWFLLALRYNGYNKKNILLILLLSIIPATTILILFTNNYHHFHYINISMNNTGPFPVAVLTKGPWFYIDYVYKNILILGGILIFLKIILKKRGLRRKQAIIIFIGSLIASSGNIMGILGVNPYGLGLDLNPFYLALSVPLFGFAMFRLRMFNITPIARNRIFEKMKDPIIVLDSKNRIADYNTVSGDLLPELTKDSIGLFIHDILKDYSTFIHILITPDNKNKEIELKLNNTTRFYSISKTKLFSTTNRHIGYIIVLHDITEQKNLLDKMHKIATIDALTEIYNRRFFMELCLKEMKLMNRYNRPLSMLMLDIDFFKKVNDKFGHPAGDLVLKNTASSLKNILRACDISGRYGGEEFIALLPETNLQGAVCIAERLRKQISTLENNYKGQSINITVSIGIAHINFNELTEITDYNKILDSLLYESDQALYRAKEQGRNQVQTYLS